MSSLVRKHINIVNVIVNNCGEDRLMGQKFVLVANVSDVECNEL